MPVLPTYPGVYIEEIPSGVRTIVGVATSITAFIGKARRGPGNKTVTINNFGDFERQFGGLWVESRLAYAVRDFFLNGGSQAIIVRIASPNFDPGEDASKLMTAVKAVIGAAEGAADGAAAKAAAQAIDDAAQLDNHKTAGEKKASNRALAVVKSLPDNATQAEIRDAKLANNVIPNSAWLELGSNHKLRLQAMSPGTWGQSLRARVDYNVFEDKNLPRSYQVADIKVTDLFNLTVHDHETKAIEVFRNVHLKPGPRQLIKVLENESQLVRLSGTPTVRPEETDRDAVTKAQADSDNARHDANANPNDTDKKKKADNLEKLLKDLKDNEQRLDDKKIANPVAVDDPYRWVSPADDAGGSDGGGLTADDFTGEGMASGKRGLYALEDTDLFNMLYIPPYKDLSNPDQGGDVDPDLVAEAEKYCRDRRAMLIVDSPSGWTTKDKARDGMGAVETQATTTNSAIFFPRLRQPNPERDGQMETFGVGGTIAGVFARTDVERGVWKAPAGLDATLRGTPELTVKLTDPENGELNPLGLNCLRAFPVVGRVIWGSRTARGADLLADDYKYIPVRRTALFIEESLYRGTHWVVFEPNDERTWAAIRLNVGAFMHDLFRKGAFQTKSSNARDSYFVKCDAESTTQNDINLGIVNIVVGFAPLKPAEFVIIKLQQIVGDIQV